MPTITHRILGPYSPDIVRARMVSGRTERFFYANAGPSIPSFGQCLKGRTGESARLSPDPGKRKMKVAGCVKRAHHPVEDRRIRSDARTSKCKRVSGPMLDLMLLKEEFGL